MTLRLYNTLTRCKEPFAPQRPPKVGIYVCGVTVWDSTHLGHARAAIVFDTIVRYLRHRGFQVTYVKNYTDVDDKIIRRANQDGVPWTAVAEKYIAEYSRDMERLGTVKPDVEPRASAHIGDMIAMIETLMARGLAYETQGDVFYAVRTCADYGQLSGKKIEELAVGARVEANEAKRDPLDFALWKRAKPDEPSWPSPWGPGRPGWHIECSAMSTKYLGQPIDIHGGGRDLIFPHHENEIAQAEGASGTPFVRCWMHNGSLTIDSEKMSKSLGNYFRTSEALQQYDAEVIRYFLLSSHYRSPLDFSTMALTDMGRAVTRFYDATGRLGQATAGAFPAAPPKTLPDEARPLVRRLQTFHEELHEALDDDLNTPKVFGMMFELVRDLNRYLDTQHGRHGPIHHWIQMAWSTLRQQCHRILGLFGSDAADFRERMKAMALGKRGVDHATVEQLIAQRNTARRTKDFATADQIRDQLTAMGVSFKDRADGTTEWHVE
ncbi:MAG: cysteine--tRNA ligase [Deltaproteobacteria bacterium]|nr:cysteine--tRNA ligase [Deltaproteobacteria bacterium]